MRIIVCVRQGLDPKTVKISRSREEFDLREAARRTQLEDKWALEVALRLREAGGGEVIALTVASLSGEEASRAAVAMGVDRAVLVLAPEPVSGQGMTAVVAAAVERIGGADLVVTGQPAALDPAGPLAPRLAAALDLPLLMDVLAFEATAGGLVALAACDHEAVRMPVTLPAVAEVMPGVDRPRYPHPSRIAVAWQPEYLETWTADELGVAPEALDADVETGNLVLGAERQRGEILGGEPTEAATQLLGLLAGKRLI